MTKTEAIRRALKPGQAPTMDELRPRVERALKQIIGKHKLYALLTQMQISGEIGTVGRGQHRRYVLVTS